MYWNISIKDKEYIVNKLNSNIRCIEISYPHLRIYYLPRWIVTLDVLKSGCIFTKLDPHPGWIVTLDVLK